MLAKYVNKDEYMFIDSTGKEPGKISIQGSNPEHCRLVDLAINKMIYVRSVEPDGNRVIRDSKGKIVRNTCSTEYFTKELPKVMEGLGYRIST